MIANLRKIKNLTVIQNNPLMMRESWMRKYGKILFWKCNRQSKIGERIAAVVDYCKIRGLVFGVGEKSGNVIKVGSCLEMGKSGNVEKVG